MTVSDTLDGARARTRRAILDAAVEVLAVNPAAPLADIATAADVGRSTLHRYFPERADLLRALARHVHALSNAAIAHAEPWCGHPVDALRRVVSAQLDLGPIVAFVYTEPTIVSDPELKAHLDSGDEAIVEALDRVSRHTTGPPGWPRTVFWALIQAGYEAIRRDGVTRVQVVEAIMTSLTQGTINPNPSS